MDSMRTRRWLLFGAGVLVVALGVGLWALPEVIRRVAISQIHAMTGRPVQIDRVDGNALTGRFAVRGFRLAERDGQLVAVFEEREDEPHEERVEAERGDGAHQSTSPIANTTAPRLSMRSLTSRRAPCSRKPTLDGFQ